MKTILLKVIRLFVGLFLYALGIVITINANIGLAPWDVFHQGLGFKFNITMGQASIIVGFLLILFNFIFSQGIGWGTISNMFFIGFFLDIIMRNHWIPVFNNIILQFIMMSIGLFIIGIASVFYLGVGLGSGPRDGLMVGLTQLTGKSVPFIRNSIEIIVLIMGFFLGGSVGIGTVYMSLSVGFFINLAFKLFNFNVKNVEHRYISQDIKLLLKNLAQT